MRLRAVALVVSYCLLLSRDAAAQSPVTDSVSLPTLQQLARSRDPRSRQLELLSAQSDLRRRNIASEMLPALSVESQAQYQSDAVRFPITLPGGQRPPTPPKDTYDAHAGVQQRIYDPARGPRLRLENAQLAESSARVRTSLYAVAQSVNDAFFTALRSEIQITELETTLADLDAQLAVASARVRDGTALPSEALTLRAEVLRRRQLVSESAAMRRVSLIVLEQLTGRPIDSTMRLRTPDLAGEVARTGAVSALRSRPEYDQFARARDVIDEQRLVRGAQSRPRVSAYGRGGYGRPALNPLSDKFDTYYLAGVQLQWSPFGWGATDRDRELLKLQSQIVSTEETAFTDAIQRAVVQDIAAMERLESTLRSDDEIIALRETIAAETRTRYSEGVVTSAEYVDRQTDVLSARINRAMHRVELAQARARYLTTLGVETR